MLRGCRREGAARPRTKQVPSTSKEADAEDHVQADHNDPSRLASIVNCEASVYNTSPEAWWKNDNLSQKQEAKQVDHRRVGTTSWPDCEPKAPGAKPPRATLKETSARRETPRTEARHQFSQPPPTRGATSVRHKFGRHISDGSA